MLLTMLEPEEFLCVRMRVAGRARQPGIARRNGVHLLHPCFRLWALAPSLVQLHERRDEARVPFHSVEVENALRRVPRLLVRTEESGHVLVDVGAVSVPAEISRFLPPFPLPRPVVLVIGRLIVTALPFVDGCAAFLRSLCNLFAPRLPLPLLASGDSGLLFDELSSADAA